MHDNERNTYWPFLRYHLIVYRITLLDLHDFYIYDTRLHPTACVHLYVNIMFIVVANLVNLYIYVRNITYEVRDIRIINCGCTSTFHFLVYFSRIM